MTTSQKLLDQIKTLCEDHAHHLDYDIVQGDHFFGIVLENSNSYQMGISCHLDSDVTQYQVKCTVKTIDCDGDPIDIEKPQFYTNDDELYQAISQKISWFASKQIGIITPAYHEVITMLPEGYTAEYFQSEEDDVLEIKHKDTIFACVVYKASTVKYRVNMRILDENYNLIYELSSTRFAVLVKDRIIQLVQAFLDGVFTAPDKSSQYNQFLAGSLINKLGSDIDYIEALELVRILAANGLIAQDKQPGFKLDTDSLIPIFD